MDNVTGDLRNVFSQVVAGHDFVDVAHMEGWSRQTVKDRVLRLARALQEVVGVEGVEDDAEPTLELLHRHHEAYLEALAHYDPARAIAPRGHREACERDLEEILRAIGGRRRCRERDTAVVLTLFATGAKPGEIALLVVADYLNVDGTVRLESAMRPEAAFNRRTRPLYFTNERARTALDAYLAVRAAQHHGIGEPGRYRGLAPASPLFLRHDGAPFGDDDDGAISAVQTLCHRLIKGAGSSDLSALSARRVVANRLDRRGRGQDEIARVLGLDSPDSVRRLLCGGRPTLAQAMGEMF